MVLQLILASKLSELEQFEIFWDPSFFWLTLYVYLSVVNFACDIIDSFVKELLDTRKRQQGLLK